MLDPPLPTSDMTGPYVYSLVPIANLHAEVRTGYEARPVTELRMSTTCIVTRLLGLTFDCSCLLCGLVCPHSKASA